jgi:hypothetical protein
MVPLRLPFATRPIIAGQARGCRTIIVAAIGVLDKAELRSGGRCLTPSRQLRRIGSGIA